MILHPALYRLQRLQQLAVVENTQYSGGGVVSSSAMGTRLDVFAHTQVCSSHTQLGGTLTLCLQCVISDIRTMRSRTSTQLGHLKSLSVVLGMSMLANMGSGGCTLDRGVSSLWAATAGLSREKHRKLRTRIDRLHGCRGAAMTAMWGKEPSSFMV